MTQHPARSLRLEPEEMRRTGYAVVDLLVEALSAPGAPSTRVPASALSPELSAPPPDAPLPFGELLAHVRDDLIPTAARGDHPGFFAFIPYCQTWPGALGDLVASALNMDASTWMLSPGPTTVELGLVRWLCDLVGYPAEAGGLFVSGGSAANLTALACAREHVAGAMSDRLALYLSDQGHSSLARAARTLGFRVDQVRVIPTDRASRMRLDALEAALRRDAAAGMVPLAVVANAGTTSTGAIDRLAELAALCRAHGAWLHVDAAYGGGAAITERGRALLAGIEQADSITLDPHKWLYQPFELGAVLVREERLLDRAFAIHPDYLQDTEQDVNLGDRGLQLTRSFRALKLWWSLRAFGVDAFRSAIEHSMDMAALAARLVESHPRLEILTPPSLGIVCFRRIVDGGDEAAHEAANAALVAALEATGRALLSSTRVDGRYALRLCVMNDTTDRAAIEHVVGFLGDHPAVPLDAPAAAIEERDGVVAGGWPEPAVAAAELRSVPVLGDLTDDDLAWLVSIGEPRTLPAGAVLIERWGLDRELFLVLDGACAVYEDERLVATLGPGDVAGELAALDWGAGYGVLRRAAVVATAPTRVLALPLASSEALARRHPAVAARLRALGGERLAELEGTGPA